ncbi:murein hydrolase activator EnvC family protein [Streptomyces hygroscopicus]|uniref:murein hydrolase activator EnvC family protein n=1 Tax=Streptomyces hygroscopicus TaxID=1912 RepID=UPI003789A5D8
MASSRPAAAGPGGERSWPVDGAPGAVRPSVLRGWRPPPVPWAAGHRGVDLAARPGERVRAAAAGRVSFAGPVAGRGVLVIELSGTGSPPARTTYEPVRATVAKGARVTAGQVVGVVAPGPFHCRSSCLHWGLRRADRYLDPLSLLPPSMLRGGPSRLLPVFGVRDAPTVAALVSPPGGARPATAGALVAASVWARIRLGRLAHPGGDVRRRRPVPAPPGPGAGAVPAPEGAAEVSPGRRAGPWRRPPR